MKERPESERIEIELTSNVLPDADPDGGEVVVEGPSDESSPAAATDQRRMFAVATVVGVVALLLGWLIGRSSGADEVATTSVTMPETTEAVVATVLPGETLPSAATTTARPRRTTTTSTLAVSVVETIEIDPRLADIELTLVGSDGRNVLVELDLAEHTVTRRELRWSFEPEAVYVGEDWVALLSPGGGSTYLVRDGQPRELADLGEPWEVLWQPGTDRFWRPDWDGVGFNGPSLYEEIDLTGEPTGVTLELPLGTWVERVDPKGGLIIEVAGKSYSIAESGVSLVGVGELLGVSADMAVMRDCDEQLNCGLVVTDRRTGARRDLVLDPPQDELPVEPMFGWGPPDQRSTISPDNGMVVVRLPSVDEPLLGLIDLDSGAVVELGGTWWMPAVVWSPDARFVFFLGGDPESGEFASGGLMVHDRVSGEIFPVSPEPLQWDMIAARPAAVE